MQRNAPPPWDCCRKRCRPPVAAQLKESVAVSPSLAGGNTTDYVLILCTKCTWATCVFFWSKKKWKICKRSLGCRVPRRHRLHRYCRSLHSIGFAQTPLQRSYVMLCHILTPNVVSVLEYWELGYERSSWSDMQTTASFKTCFVMFCDVLWCFMGSSKGVVLFFPFFQPGKHQKLLRCWLSSHHRNLPACGRSTRGGNFLGDMGLVDVSTTRIYHDLPWFGWL